MKKGNNTISSIYKGSKAIDKIMKGTLVVYEAWKELIASGVPPITLQKCKGVDLVDYKIYGDSKQELLPSEYQQVEYIESTATQFINTGVNPSKLMKIDITLSQSDQNTILGAYNSTNNRFQLFAGIEDITQKLSYRLYGSTVYRVNTWDKTTKNHLIFDVKNLTSQLNGVNYPLTIESEEGITYPIYLFAGNNAGETHTPSETKIYGCKIYDDDILVRDFIPCYRISDEVIGMYDLANDVFYINKGTGTFLKGENVMPTPTPDAPIEVISVGDKTANVMSNVATSKTRNGIEFTVNNDKSITINGTNTGSIFTFSINNDNDYTARTEILKANTTYTLNGGAVLPDGVFLQAYGPINGSSAYRTYENTPYTFKTVESGLWGWYIRIDEGVTLDNLTIYPQLEEGSVATAYEPYGYKIPVKVSGKNLFNPLAKMDNTQSIVDRVSSVTFEDGKTTIKSTGAGMTAFCYKIPVVKGVKYTVSISSITGTNDKIFVSNTYHPDDSSYGRLTPTNKTITFTPTSNYVWLKGYVAYTAIVGTVTITNLQLERGSSKTDYEPYVEPITTNIYLNQPLRKIGNYTDYIDFENQKVFRNVRELTITGSETTWENAGNINRFKINTSRLSGDSGDFTNQRCNYFACGNISTSNNIQGVSVYYSSSLGGTYFRIRDVDYFESGTADTIAFLKEKYNSGDPCKVLYESYNTIEEEITLPNIPLNKGTNIIEVDTSILPSNMEVKYIGKE